MMILPPIDERNRTDHTYRNTNHERDATRAMHVESHNFRNASRAQEALMSGQPAKKVVSGVADEPNMDITTNKHSLLLDILIK
jgi:hypothetical protein